MSPQNSRTFASPVSTNKNGKHEEQTTVAKMIAGRNQIYCEPFDAFDPNHPLRGKKRFNENFRPLRSKINLKIAADEVQKNKKTGKVTVEQKILDDFEAAYKINCDQGKMRVKHRTVGADNPFHPKNAPPD